MIMMMMMMMTMMTYTIPYRRTKTHIWDKVLMGIWVHPRLVDQRMMNDDEMFQNSLLLLEEKMELLADLQQKAEKCR